MKTLTVRDLNRRTARVLDALERGETFEVHRRGKAVGYLSRVIPPLNRKPDWKTHFDWLRQQSGDGDAAILAEFEEGRRKLHQRDDSLDSLK